MPLELIDKQDTFEIIRDQIAALLTLETANQVALADAAGKRSELWDLRVYSERSNPWELGHGDRRPVVNIWYDSSTFNARASNVMERQAAEATYNIDCYGFADSIDVPGGGHMPGDREAAFAAQRALRLVRNILMAAENTYLQLRGTVWKRWPRSTTVFQPQFADGATVKTVGARLALQVDCNEFSPQVQAETLELLSVNVNREEDGQLIIEADYQYPL